MANIEKMLPFLCWLQSLFYYIEIENIIARILFVNSIVPNYRRYTEIVFSDTVDMSKAPCNKILVHVVGNDLILSKYS